MTSCVTRTSSTATGHIKLKLNDVAIIKKLSLVKRRETRERERRFTFTIFQFHFTDGKLGGGDKYSL